MPTFGAPPVDNFASVFRCHTRTKTMLVFALTPTGLIGSFHNRRLNSTSLGSTTLYVASMRRHIADKTAEKTKLPNILRNVKEKFPLRYMLRGAAYNPFRQLVGYY